MDGDGQVDLVGDGAEKTHIFRLGKATGRWRLQDDPIGPGGLGGAGKGDLVADGGVGNGYRQGHDAGNVLGSPLKESMALSLAELVDLGRQAQASDAVGAIGQASPGLSAHGVAVEFAVGVKKRINHGVDAAEGGWRQHGLKRPATG